MSTKVVINAKYGGFGLSNDAIREYLTRTGADWHEVAEHAMSSGYVLKGPYFYIGAPNVDENFFSDSNIDRTDPVLVAIVEEWGDRANGRYAALEVEEIPEGTKYRIHEYDGYESIETRDGFDWSEA